MQLLINNLPAALPENTQISYFAESRAFSDSAGYSLDIELPLEGCAENRRIFGRIELDPPSEAVWPARLVCDGIDTTGSILLLEVSRAKLRVQFLSGRATADYGGKLQETYINEMADLPDRINTGDFTGLLRADCQASIDRINSPEYSAIFAKTHSDTDDDRNWMELPAVALPWTNETKSTFQNCTSGGYKVWGNRVTMPPDQWPQSTRMTGLSWMPYLLPLAKAIAATAGYSVDFSEWAASDLRHLIVCNALPTGRISAQTGEGSSSLSPQVTYRCGQALPHWNVLEFFDNIAPLLDGEFTFDHLARTVRFDFSAKALQERPEVKPDIVEDGYEITSDFGMEETEGTYLRALPFRYDEAKFDMWKFMDCPWWQPSPNVTTVRWITPAEALTYMRPWRGNDKNHSWLFHAAEPNVWLCYYAWHINRFMDAGSDEVADIIPMPLNLFGPETYDGPDGNYRTLMTLPAVTAAGIVHLPPEGCDDPTAQYFRIDAEDEETDEEPEVDVTAEDYQTAAAQTVADGEPSKAEGYYDHLFVGLWRGTEAGAVKPIPETCGFRYDWDNPHNESFSMRLNAGSSPYRDLPEIDESIKFTFYFHARRFPDVDAVFNINGRRYLCRRIEATLTSRGMSRRLKGEFYPLRGVKS